MSKPTAAIWARFASHTKVDGARQKPSDRQTASAAQARMPTPLAVLSEIGPSAGDRLREARRKSVRSGGCRRENTSPPSPSFRIRIYAMPWRASRRQRGRPCASAVRRGQAAGRRKARLNRSALRPKATTCAAIRSGQTKRLAHSRTDKVPPARRRGCATTDRNAARLSARSPDTRPATTPAPARAEASGADKISAGRFGPGLNFIDEQLGNQEAA